MSKFHIGKKGPAPCTATIRNCPVGGDHFDTEKEAEAYYAKTNGGTVKSLSKAASTKTAKSTSKNSIDPTIYNTPIMKENLDLLNEAYKKTNAIIGAPINDNQLLTKTVITNNKNNTLNNNTPAKTCYNNNK